MVGQDQIAGRRVWHVKVELPKAGVEYHFWIEDETGFRVHRYEYRMPAMPTLFVVTTSEYGTDRNRPVLPTRVVESDYRCDSRIEFVYTVTEADYTIKPDPAQFGLKGLDLPPGATVIDDRISRVAGYWQARTPAS